MPNILIVCTANICRSPVAEAILRDRLQKRGLAQWTISSAGTWAEIERGAAHYSIRLMADQGYDLSEHCARMVDGELLEQADLVLCMESGHVEAIKAEFAVQANKVHLLSEMVGRSHSIPDPYGQSIQKYRIMIAEVTEIIDAGLDRIIELAEANATLNGEQ
jgi:protein-tyrosine phosphatase